MSRAALRSTIRMAMVMRRPMRGSASGNPAQHAEGAEDDGQRGEAVGAGVQAVGDERGGADASADADAVERDELVAGEPDQACGDEDADVGDGLGVEQAADRLVSGDEGRQRDHRDDEDSGQVFGSSVAVGVAAGCCATAEGEGDPQRERGQRVGEVVDGVGEQRDRAGEQDNDGLRRRAVTQQGDQADLDCADTRRRWLPARSRPSPRRRGCAGGKLKPPGVSGDSIF